MHLNKKKKSWGEFMSDTIQKSFESFFEKACDMLPKAGVFLLIIIIGFWLTKLLVKIFGKTLISKKVDESVHHFLKTCVSFIGKTIVILTALSTLGINVNAVVTAIGAAIITAGFGLKDNIAQIASGIQILITHPFKKGDFIKMDSVSGIVNQIEIMHTTLTTVGNKTVIIPNSHLTTNVIVNCTDDDMRCLELTFQISYSDDIPHAKAILKKLANESPYILKNPEPIIGVKEHGASSIVLDDIIWCRAQDYMTAFYGMQEQVKIAFDRAGIAIPFNQLDVHIISDNKKTEEDTSNDKIADTVVYKKQP